MRRLDLRDVYDRMVMVRRVEEGWMPTVGTQWAAVSYKPGTELRVYFRERGSSAEEVMARVVSTSSHMFVGPVFPYVVDETTEEDVAQWVKERDQWIADRSRQKT